MKDGNMDLCFLKMRRSMRIGLYPFSEAILLKVIGNQVDSLGYDLYFI